MHIKVTLDASVGDFGVLVWSSARITELVAGLDPAAGLSFAPEMNNSMALDLIQLCVYLFSTMSLMQ